MPEIDDIAFLKQVKASGDTTPFIINRENRYREIISLPNR